MDDIDSSHYTGSPPNVLVDPPWSAFITTSRWRSLKSMHYIFAQIFIRKRAAQVIQSIKGYRWRGYVQGYPLALSILLLATPAVCVV
jgi:hypothetical protein